VLGMGLACTHHICVYYEDASAHMPALVLDCLFGFFENSCFFRPSRPLNDSRSLRGWQRKQKVPKYQKIP